MFISDINVLRELLSASLNFADYCANVKYQSELNNFATGLPLISSCVSTGLYWDAGAYTAIIWYEIWSQYHWSKYWITIPCRCLLSEICLKALYPKSYNIISNCNLRFYNLWRVSSYNIIIIGILKIIHFCHIMSVIKDCC